jgi:cellulose synthase/poly-beta-1,6-N-acetylglucosamine synthase-like glycosyltransferase
MIEALLLKPLVSVVIPAYNAANCIKRAVDSVLAQTHGRREIVVVDDGSTDDTVRMLARYGATLRVIHQANRQVGISSGATILGDGTYNRRVAARPTPARTTIAQSAVGPGAGPVALKARSF